MMLGAILSAAVMTLPCGAPSALFARLAARGQLPVMTGHDVRDERMVVTLAQHGGGWSVVMLRTRGRAHSACVVATGDGALFAPANSGNGQGGGKR